MQLEFPQKIFLASICVRCVRAVSKTIPEYCSHCVTIKGAENVKAPGRVHAWAAGEGGIPAVGVLGVSGDRVGRPRGREGRDGGEAATTFQIHENEPCGRDRFFKY